MYNFSGKISCNSDPKRSSGVFAAILYVFFSSSFGNARWKVNVVIKEESTICCFALTGACFVTKGGFLGFLYITGQVVIRVVKR